MSIFISPKLYKAEFIEGKPSEPVEVTGNTGVEPTEGGWVIRGWARNKEEFIEDAKTYLENVK